MRGLEFQKDEEAVDRRGWVAVVRGEATTAMSPGDFRASGSPVTASFCLSRINELFVFKF
jgi:hypothetical protein